jgi:hypothetical protein
MGSNINEVLKQLDALNLENSLHIFVPSLQRTVEFKPLNLKQQKELLRTTIDESLVKLAFNNLLTNIIADNAIDKINVNALYTFDRSVIALGLRAKGLDQNLSIDNKVINLLDKLEELPNLPFDLQKFNETLTDNSVTIKLTIPKLLADKEVNSFALNKIKTTQDVDIKTVISDLVVYEFAKFIESVSVKTDDAINEIVFDNIKPSERMTIIEKFPSTITSKIFDYVKKYREFETQFTQLDGTSIDIDGNFFTV